MFCFWASFLADFSYLGAINAKRKDFTPKWHVVFHVIWFLRCCDERLRNFIKFLEKRLFTKDSFQNIFQKTILQTMPRWPAKRIPFEKRSLLLSLSLEDNSLEEKLKITFSGSWEEVATRSQVKLGIRCFSFDKCLNLIFSYSFPLDIGEMVWKWWKSMRFKLDLTLLYNDLGWLSNFLTASLLL